MPPGQAAAGNTRMPSSGQFCTAGEITESSNQFDPNYDPMGGDLLLEQGYVGQEHFDPLEDLLSPMDPIPRIVSKQYGVQSELQHNGLFDIPVSAAQPYAYWRKNSIDGSGVLIIEQAGEPKLIIQVPTDREQSGVLPGGMGSQIVLMLFALVMIACWKKFSDFQ